MTLEELTAQRDALPAVRYRDLRTVEIDGRPRLPGLCFCERNRITLLIGRWWIGIDLVQKQVARRHRAQAHRAVRAVMMSSPAGNSLDSTVLPASRARDGLPRSRSAEE